MTKYFSLFSFLFCFSFKLHILSFRLSFLAYCTILSLLISFVLAKLHPTLIFRIVFLIVSGESKREVQFYSDGRGDEAT
jgi:hypothetical protein